MNGYIRKKMARFSRKVGFIIISLILRWPIWGLLFCLKPLKPFSYLFLVYPGTDSDLDGYCLHWLAKSWLFSKKPTIGGIISKGSCGRGLVLVVPNTVDEFISSKVVCEEVLQRLAWIKNLTGAKAISIAGQVPGIISRHGISLDEPFVRGNKGGAFCIMETVAETALKHGLSAGEFLIVLVGVGFLGSLTYDLLQREGHQILGIDIIPTKNGVVLPERASQSLGVADMAIVLTPRGSDFAPYVRYLKKGAILIDDTHPKIRKKLDGAVFYKVAVGINGSKFYPKLPGYKADWIPGCAVEAMFAAGTGEFNDIPQEKFNQKVKKLGFFAHLVG